MLAERRAAAEARVALWLAALFFALAASSCFAQARMIVDDRPPPLAVSPASPSPEQPRAEAEKRRPAGLPIVDVAVFKQGQALILAEGEVEVDRGLCRVAPLPPAIGGTLWFYTRDPQRTVARVRGATVVRQKKYRAEARDLGQLLRMNIGRTVHLSGLRWRLSLEGKLAGVLPPDETQKIQHLLIERDGKIELVEFSRVETVVFVDGDPRRAEERERREELAVAEVALGGGQEPVVLGVGFVASGLSWQPVYHLASRGEEGTLELHAQLRNNSPWALEGAAVHLAAGPGPTLRGESFLDLSLVECWAEFAQHLAGAHGAALAQATMAADIAPQLAVNLRPSSAFEDRPDVPGALFLYTIAGVSLEPGKSAGFCAFRESVSLANVFLLELRTYNEQLWQHSNAEKIIAAELSRSRVQEALRLINRGPHPWAAGPIVVTEGGRALARGVLPLVLVGESADLPVKPAYDIPVEGRERLAGREERALVEDEQSYDCLTITGEVSVQNTRQEAMTLVVRRQLYGTLVSWSAGGTPRPQPLERERKINPVSRVDWELNIPAGAKRTVSYEYRFFVPTASVEAPAGG